MTYERRQSQSVRTFGDKPILSKKDSELLAEVKSEGSEDSDGEKQEGKQSSGQLPVEESKEPQIALLQGQNAPNKKGGDKPGDQKMANVGASLV